MGLAVLLISFILIIIAILIGIDILIGAYVKRMKKISLGIGIMVEKQKKELDRLKKEILRFFFFVILASLLYITGLCMLWLL